MTTQSSTFGQGREQPYQTERYLEAAFILPGTQ